MTPLRSGALILVLGCWLPGALRALPPAAPVPHVAPAPRGTAEHEGVSQHVIAAKAIVVVEKTKEESEVVSGPGFLYELTLVPHALEVEGAAAVVFGGGKTSLPFDLLVKVPIALNRVVDFYVGLGPAAKITLRPEAEMHFGLLASLGSYFWLSRHWGLLAEVDYGYLAEGGGMHELEAGAGAALRLF